MIFGVWAGFAAAIHYADSPTLYAAVAHASHTLNPLFDKHKTHAPEDNDALVVTLDHNIELTSVATLSPRGYHPTIATGAQDALERVHTAGRVWKLVVIDAGLPQAAALTQKVREALPAANIVAVQGHRGTQAVSRALLECLNAPPREAVPN